MKRALLYLMTLGFTVTLSRAKGLPTLRIDDVGFCDQAVVWNIIQEDGYPGETHHANIGAHHIDSQ